MSASEKISFHEVINALEDANTPFHPRFLYRLSDLDPSEVNQLESAWSQIPLWRRQALMEDVEELSNHDTLLSFLELGCLAIRDEDPTVRQLAIQTLWDYEDTHLIPLFLEAAVQDADIQVRAAAAGALGRYVYAGELDEIPLKVLKKIEDTLLMLAEKDEAPAVRRSALEALGYSSRDEVPALIDKAYHSNEKEWIASALFAMGRSADPVWKPYIMAMLENKLPLLRAEAARAAGELEISEAMPYLLDLLDDPDENTRLASIWSLSQTGGEGVRERLEQLYAQAEDDQELELLESALENLAFTEGVQYMPFLNLPDDEDEMEDDLDDFDDIEDLDEELDD